MSVPAAQRPVLVRGMSRSGGTLVATILDSHPDLAMSYELYPKLLALPDGSPAGLRVVVDAIEQADGRPLAEVVGHPRFVTFVNRLPRSGLDRAAVVAVFRAHLAGGRGVRTAAERVRLVEAFATAKATALGRPRWGAKCLADYDDYLEVFPRAAFVNVVRDGRDVLASTLHQMRRPREVEQVARGWVSTHRRFRALLQRDDVTAHEVVYEDLVTAPEPTLRALCTAIDLPFDLALLEHQHVAHSVYGASHLSGARLRQPIDGSSIGRWRRDLTAQQVEAFLAVAGDTMARMGYST